MRIAIGLAILLATASLAHAEVGIYTGHGTIEAIKWVGTPDAPPMYRAFRGEYDGPMRASIEQRPNEERDCDRSLPMTIVAGVTLELGTWLNFQTGETGEASGGFYGRGVREDCYNPIGWVSLGPAGPSSQFVGISVSTLNGTQASVSIRTYNTLMDYGDAQFTGTRSEVYVNVEPKVLDLSSAGGRVKAELWTDGTISIDEIALTSIRLGGAQSSSIRIEGERIVAHFPERGAGTDLSVGPAVPLTLSGRLIDGLRFTVTDTVQVIDPSRTMFYVDADAAGANDGSDWVNAYKDLQDALRRMESGDEVWVAEGVYKPTSGYDQTATFRLVNGSRMYGGFAGSESSLAQRKPLLHATVLSGDLGVERTESDEYPEYGPHAADNSNQVVLAQGADESTVLDGFEITACRTFMSPASGEDEPAGMRLVDSNPTLANLVFRELGGISAMRNIRSSPSMREIDFVGNVCMVSGGMWNTQSDPVIVGASFVDNGARWSQQAGAVVNDDSSPLFFRTVFEHNGTEGGGGGAMCNAGTSAPVLINVLFSRNPFGAIAHSGENMRLINVTFAENGGPVWYEGAVLWASGPCDIANSIFSSSLWNWGGRPIGGTGTIRVANSAVQGSGGSGASWDREYGIDLGGNIDVEPIFVSLEAGDFRLAPGSPCIDAGDRLSLPEGISTDLAGAPRVCGANVDMGAYEYQGPGPHPLFAAQFTPATLNQASEGASVQVMLRPLREVLPTEIVESSVALLDSIAPLPGSAKVGKAQLKAKFDREAVIAALAPGAWVPVTISGLLKDGRKFVAVDTIQVIGTNSGQPEAWSGAASINSDAVGAPRSYLRAAPNPFNPSTTIYYCVARPGPVELTIYDLAGRQVKTLVSGHATAGDNEVNWDGRDEAGKRVASGVYLYRLTADGFIESKRMVLVK